MVAAAGEEEVDRRRRDKLMYSTGVTTRRGSDFDTFSITWQRPLGSSGPAPPVAELLRRSECRLTGIIALFMFFEITYHRQDRLPPRRSSDRIRDDGSFSAELTATIEHIFKNKNLRA